ncbi:interferon-inducible GTPase 5-like [Paramacrobiotus metropolitanus]|uniref:interferon-inducible GTPase 5-like n=1 Tax=Paramacrobiotus metropolitanus TaxID=2943436 RepID=UPI002445DD32|nr:interferon-inducible GTPase 5-like [Paramacrobiotus metropolitanus]
MNSTGNTVRKLGFSADNVKQIEEAYRLGGTAEFSRILQEEVDGWKAVPLNIAVIGKTGSGKSSYINCARHVTAEDPEGALVGITETTKIIKSYPHPENNMLLYWDLPGVGTENFPRETYLDDIEFKSYDFYLILSCMRFTVHDLWLAEVIKNEGKKFFYVRTHSDSDVQNQKKSHPKASAGKSDEEILQEVRKDIIKRLQLNEADQDNVFLIDCHEPSKFDYEKLQERLLKSLPELKREVYLNSLNPIRMLSKKILQEKLDALRGRALITAMLSGLCGLVSTPEVSAAADLHLAIRTSTFYLEQLGLDQKSLAATAAAHGIDVDCLDKHVGLRIEDLSTSDCITSLYEQLGHQTPARSIEELKSFIPIFGFLLNGPLSSLNTSNALLAILQQMESVAHKVIDVCVDKVHQKVLNESG